VPCPVQKHCFLELTDVAAQCRNGVLHAKNVKEYYYFIDNNDNA